MQVQFTGKNIWFVLGITLLALGAGYVGGHFPSVGGATVAVVASDQANSNQRTQGPSWEDHTAPIWNGLPQASESWITQVATARVEELNGQLTTVPSDKPILLTAYWCPYCHQELQLLNKHHLMSKVQVVALDFQGGEGQNAPQKVTSADKAARIYQDSLRKIGVSIPANQILYSMPGGTLDSEISSIPVMLVPHNGHWYIQNGYITDVSLWKRLLS